MTEALPHIDHLIGDWLDGRLNEHEQYQCERHVRECEACRRQHEALAVVRRSARGRGGETVVPDELRERVRRTLDQEDAARSAGPPAGPRRRLLLAAAAVLAAAGIARWLPHRRAADPVAQLAADYARWAQGALPDFLAAAQPSVVEGRWRASRLDFPARVLDLSAMGITLEGGGAFALSEVTAARTIYRGGPDRILCYMFRGELLRLPAAEERSHGGFTFRVFRRGGVTVVAWQEGAVLCALAGARDPESVVQLAFAKAMAPPPRA